MDFQKLAEAVVEGNVKKVKGLTEKLLSEGIRPDIILNEGLLKGMQKVSDRYKEKDFYIPEVLLSSRAMQAGFHIIKPLIEDNSTSALPHKVVIGTVAGDLHDIGKNLVSLMLKSRGFHVIDLGIDVPPEDFVEAVKKHQPDILAMSSLLTTTLAIIPETIRLLKKENYRDKVKIMVGGAPVTRDYAHAVGSDGYAHDAINAVVVALDLVKS